MQSGSSLSAKRSRCTDDAQVFYIDASLAEDDPHLDWAVIDISRPKKIQHMACQKKESIIMRLAGLRPSRLMHRQSAEQANFVHLPHAGFDWLYI